MSAPKFPDKTPGEVKLCTFDFTNEAESSTVLSNPSVTKSIVTGDDVDAATLTVGTPGMTGTLLKVLIGGGTNGCKYRLRASVQADNGEKHDVDGIMSVKESAG